METKKQQVRKVLITIENAEKWPFVGNAFANANGSLSVYLDRGVKLTLANGQVLESGESAPIKLYVKPAYTREAKA